MQRSDLEVKLSTFVSDDGSKKAVIWSINGGSSYVIDLYAGDNLIDYLVIKDKSIYYVEDAAENFILGIYKSPLHDV